LSKSKEKGRKIEADLLIAIITACFVLAMLIAYTIPMIWNPMRRPDPMPTNYVLSITPLGTHIDDVISIVESYRDWRIERINRERGFVHPEERPIIIGDKSAIVDSGYYRFYGWIKGITVTIFYGFDADGYLTEVFVW